MEFPAPEPPLGGSKDRLPHDLYDQTTEQKLLADIMQHTARGLARSSFTRT